MTNIAMVFRWPIEIDGLPNLNMGGFSIKELLVITNRVYIGNINDMYYSMIDIYFSLPAQ